MSDKELDPLTDLGETLIDLRNQLEALAPTIDERQAEGILMLSKRAIDLWVMAVRTL